MNKAQDRDVEELLAAARAWLAEDPDAATREELAALIERNEVDDLADRFAGFLEFGTAGLRGALGAGPNRMNRVVVIRAAAGLAAYVQQHGGGAVVIGYDARYNSDVFARDTAAVMTGAGLAAMVLPHPLPTPVLAHAIRELGCAAGVMVTASHNPPQDNGYKVYLGDGSQIVPPADAEIAALIDAVGPLATVPLGQEWMTLDHAIVDDYVATVAALVEPGVPRDVIAVYSAMHGVGGEVVLATLRAAGFADPVRVEAQFEPDPEFPTVAFPNPEEPGAIDLALEAARASDADIVVANDPDADRCAAAIRDRDGHWRMLRGDEVGALLGMHLLRRGARGVDDAGVAKRSRGDHDHRRGIFANSIVSSSLLGKICARHGMPHVETLTGFKWIARVDGLAYGYEEALGYCVDPSSVRDKDGISALLLVLELAAMVKADGRTLLDELDDLAIAYGLHQTDQLSVRVDDLSVIDAVMARLRATPPAALAGATVTSTEDLNEGAGGLPPTDGLRYRLDDGSRVIVRPSGTEPKLKCYLEVVVRVEGEDVAAAHQVARARLDHLRLDIASAAGLP